MGGFSIEKAALGNKRRGHGATERSLASSKVPRAGDIVSIGKARNVNISCEKPLVVCVYKMTDSVVDLWETAPVGDKPAQLHQLQLGHAVSKPITEKLMFEFESFLAEPRKEDPTMPKSIKDLRIQRGIWWEARKHNGRDVENDQAQAALYVVGDVRKGYALLDAWLCFRIGCIGLGAMPQLQIHLHSSVDATAVHDWAYPNTTLHEAAAVLPSDVFACPQIFQKLPIEMTITATGLGQVQVNVQNHSLALQSRLEKLGWNAAVTLGGNQASLSLNAGCQQEASNLIKAIGQPNLNNVVMRVQVNAQLPEDPQVVSLVAVLRRMPCLHFTAGNP